MTHEEKVDHFLRDMRRRRVSDSTAAPLVVQLLWAMRLRVRPPLMASWWSVFITMGTTLGVAFGLLMLLAAWRSLDAMAVLAILQLTPMAGVLFGTSLACFFRWRALRLGLPAWKDYPTSDLVA